MRDHDARRFSVADFATNADRFDAYDELCDRLEAELSATKEKLEAAERRWLSERQLNDALQNQVNARNSANAELRKQLEAGIAQNKELWNLNAELQKQLESLNDLHH